MTVPDVLTMTAGKPFSQSIRIPDIKTVWTTLDQFEVRSQLRQGKTTADELIDNLHNYMTWVFAGNDLVISWVMTGAQTRVLYALNWGESKKGYFNIIVSDVGVTDGRALVVPVLSLKAVDTTTTAAGAL